MFREISKTLRQLYLDDARPWLVGFSGGKDSTLVAALVFDAVLSVPPEQRTKPVTILSTDKCKAGISHKRVQRSQRTRRADGVTLSASLGERAGVRCRIPLTCTAVERDNRVARATRPRVSATHRYNSEGLLASGDDRMEKLIEFHEALLSYQDPANGKRNIKRKNGLKLCML